MNPKNDTLPAGWLRRLILVGFLLASSASWAQASFTINSTSDRSNDDPGNGVCDTGAMIEIEGSFEVECTLRAAIEEANQATGTITFNVSSGISSTDGLSVIYVHNSLPFITSRIVLAGETHPLYEPTNGRPRLYISYIGGTGDFSGLHFLASGAGSTVRHVGITNFGGSGILLSGGGGYTIVDNVIGLRWLPNQLTRQGNGQHGIDVNNASASGSGNVSMILNNVILGSQVNGIRLREGTASAIISGNVIGLVPGLSDGPYTPTPDWGNGNAGIHVTADAGTNNFIGDFFGVGVNTISNNGAGGIRINADGQRVLGNHIGVPLDGVVAHNYSLADYGNLGNAIVLESSGNSVGETGAATNIIGNAQFVGIRVGNGGAANIAANNNSIRHNFIGVMPDGRDIGQSQGIRIDNGSDNMIVGSEIANNNTGIEFRSAGNTARANTILDNSQHGVWLRAGAVIGGPEAAHANVIGRSFTGVLISSRLASGVTLISGNFIGTNADGDNLGNTVGVLVNGSGVTCTALCFVDIGQVEQGAANTIGYSSSHGIWLGSDSVEPWVYGNNIGLHSNGQPIPNGVGMYIGQNGGTVSNSRTQFNIIAGNSSDGVRVGAADGSGEALGNRILQNSIFANGGLGISLGPNGGTVDVGGAATGPNRLQNFPEFDANNTSYDSDTNTLTYRFRIQTETANASYPLWVEFFRSDGGEGQGRTYLGGLNYESENAMDWLSGSFNPPVQIEVYGSLVATATDSDGNTSQFSPAMALLGERQDNIFRSRFEEQSLQPGVSFRDCEDCPEMMVIPGGSFVMGSPESEPQSEDNERPQRTVNVPAFAMGQYAVTFNEWDACVADGGCTQVPADSGWGRGSRPVINVNWNDAQQYVTWLNNKTGEDYRLPSESEWEYATRAGTTGRFNTGDCITADQANFRSEFPAQGCPVGLYRQQTLPVGSFAPNAYGLYDTHGNVEEWVEDCWNENYVGAPSDGSAWMSGDCSRGVLRGGSWLNSGIWLRSAFRRNNFRGPRTTNWGFRVARSVAP